jgi:hypothetical protein
MSLSEFATGAVDTSDIANGAITSAHILDGSVTPIMIQSDSITSGNIPPGWASREKIATAAVSSTKIASASVTASTIGAGVVTANHFSAGSILAQHLLNNVVVLGKVALGSIGLDKFSESLGVDKGGTGLATFTTNSVPHFDGAGTGMSEDSLLVYDGSHLGIGTASPEYGVHVQQNGLTTLMMETGTASDLAINFLRSGSEWRVAFDGAGGLKWNLNGSSTASMVFTSTGRLGIGDASPSERLSVNGGVVLNEDLNSYPGTVYYSGNVLYGYASTASVQLMVSFGGEMESANSILDTGIQTQLNVIGGGENHRAELLGNVILGGFGNAVTGNYSSILGGQSHVILGDYSVVLGGATHNVQSDYSVVLGGANHTVTSDYGVIAGGDTNSVGGEYAIVSGGKNNRALGDYSMVGGGTGNVVAGDWSTIVGGNGNSILNGDEARVMGGDSVFIAQAAPQDSHYAFILGGQNNTLIGSNSVIGSGLNQSLSGFASTILGGVSHVLEGEYSLIGAGRSNRLSGEGNAIFSGKSNRVSGRGSSIFSGRHNTVSGRDSSIASGEDQLIQGDYASVGAGSDNQVVGHHSAILSGKSNRLDAAYGVLAGERNTVLGDHNTVLVGTNSQIMGAGSTLLGGHSHRISGNFNAAIGGTSNQIDGDSVSALSGDHNRISGDFATAVGGNHSVISGDYATVLGGSHNQASGLHSTIVGGQFNQALGEGSVAMGQHAIAADDGSFVFSDSSSDQSQESEGAGSFTMRAMGGVRFLNGNGQIVAVVDAGSGSWAHVSDRNRKHRFGSVDARRVLSQLRDIPISYWRYKGAADAVLHLGPMAQDFYGMFLLGEGPTSISQVDADGVALAALKGMHAEIVSQEQEIEELKAAIYLVKNEIDAASAQLEYGDILMSRLAHRGDRVNQKQLALERDQLDLLQTIDSVAQRLSKGGR